MKYFLHQNVFIVFEGIDKAGKSGLIKLISNSLTSRGIPNIKTYEPYDKIENEMGWKTRQVLLKELPNPGFWELQLRYFLPARVWHLANIILPALEKGFVVLCDRYYESTMAFGRVSAGIPCDVVFGWHGECYYPTLTIIVDISAKVAKARYDIEVKKAGGTVQDDLFDSKWHMQARIRETYLELANIGHPYMPNAVVINGDQTPEEVARDAMIVINKHLKERLAV